MLNEIIQGEAGEVTVDHMDCPSPVIERWNGVEVEEAGKGQKMFKCFEGEGK